jgi:hypothetical protein
VTSEIIMLCVHYNRRANSIKVHASRQEVLDLGMGKKFEFEVWTCHKGRTRLHDELILF